MISKVLRLLIILTMFMGALAHAPAAMAQSPACDTRVNNTHAKLLDCVTVEGVREHQAAFQAIADDNGGTRVAGSPGYDESAEYVYNRMLAAGYNVTMQEFQFQTFVSLTPSILEQVAPAPGGPITHSIISYSGSGDVTAPVSMPSGDVRGCYATDWSGFPAGNIALVERGAPPGFVGSCTFALKATNAYAAGAEGVIIYNNVAGSFNPTLGNTFTLDIPVVAVSLAVGQQLAATPGLVVHLKTDTFRGIATTANVIAESKSGNPNNVVMAGAHLDSVNAGPGINDNGSGSAALLEVAEQMAKVKPRNKVRFAWWGAEEASLVGSTFYVNSLSAEELAKITLYLNFDMVGSPNHVFFIYDGDNDAFPVGPGVAAGPPGSDAIEQLFETYYASRGLPSKPTPFSGRSDYGPFIAVGIPSGGLFTGAEGIKTPQEAIDFGGVAGQPYDPCYHQACDTYMNVNMFALDVNSDAIAYAVLQYAMSTSDLNGLRGKGNFKLPPPEELPTE
jgi:aminopeptidase Y